VNVRRHRSGDAAVEEQLERALELLDRQGAVIPRLQDEAAASTRHAHEFKDIAAKWQQLYHELKAATLAHLARSGAA